MAVYLAPASTIALGLIADVHEGQQGAEFGNLKSLKVREIAGRTLIEPLISTATGQVGPNS